MLIVEAEDVTDDLYERFECPVSAAASAGFFVYKREAPRTLIRAEVTIQADSYCTKIARSVSLTAD